MYLDYFDLKRHPFRITPDPTLFCPGGGRGEILDALIYAITTGEGIVKVVGEVGSGKTMLCRILEERLPESVEIVYLANPKLSPRDILYAIAFELKLPVNSETERLVVMQQLQLYLLGQHAANQSVVVFIEEAQGMALDTLEEIRLLSNLETHRHKLLQIVLFGQPELEKNLRKRDIRQLKERITHSFHLGPLTTAETSEYMRFRLQAAGCGKSGVFSAGAERLISRVSCGLIRRINILADKAMLAAYADSAVRSISGSTRAMVHARHVRAAIRDSEFHLPFFRSAWVTALGLISLLVVLTLIFGWNQFSSTKGFSVFWTGNPLLSAPVEMGGQTESALAGNEARPGKGIEEEGVASGVPAELKEQEADLSALPAEVEIGNRSAFTASAIPTFAVFPDFLSPETINISSLVVDAQATETLTPELSQGAVDKSAGTLMEQRRQACSQWMEQGEAKNYTIQLMAVAMNSEVDVEVERFLQKVRPVSLLDRIYVCQDSREERHMWVIVYDDFPELIPARKAIEALPPELRRFQPFVRRFDKAWRAGNIDGVKG
ncbi:MAG: AAA family ATPase [Proteobacteria bacterium]|nr:AAA family ATPase [Pseudomonadota bacterium]MBU1648385.1 AAA family ATPase [Pseudomonadota bacterium]MBU1986922.1 AAA family ATPase [Pseudomonadota bacterium]